MKKKRVSKSPPVSTLFTWNNETLKYVRNQGAYTVCLRENGCLTSLLLPKDFFSISKHSGKQGA